MERDISLSAGHVTLEGTLSLRLGRNVRTGFRRGLVTKLDDPAQAPQANMPEALSLLEANIGGG